MISDKKVCFLVSSAISTDYGEEIERGLETINTVNSINAQFPNSVIILIESGKGQFASYFVNHFPKNVRIIQFWDDPNIEILRKQAKEYGENMVKEHTFGSNTKAQPLLELCYIKSATESYTFRHVFDRLNFQEFDYVFKLSGRYSLSSAFNMDKWYHKNKIVFRESVPTNQSGMHVPRQYTCFIWGFCPSVIDEVRRVYTDLNTYIIQELQSLKIMDMEHGLYHCLDPKHVVALSRETEEPWGVYAKMGGKRHFLI
tara:strand:+ start:1098 stop:1868 length:771 start_codon:yes stop_codon:yes gene_type:complete